MARLLWAGVLLVVTSAAGAAPIPREELRPPAQLEGTTWAGDGVCGPTTYTFEKGGVLAYSYNGQTYRNATWQQTGAEVYWEANERYCEFRGTLRGTVLTGKSWNQPGGQWTLTVKKQAGAGTTTGTDRPPR